MRPVLWYASWVLRNVAVFSCFMFAVVSTAGVGCQSATQARLELGTDIPCSRLHSIAINVGRDVSEAESQMRGRAAAAASTTCGDAGAAGIAELGSIVLYPGDGKARDGNGAVIVRAGIGSQDPYECLPPDYKGCVVAKRRFAYEPRQSLDFRINLLLACLDYPCDATRTCIAQETCWDNDIKSFLPSGNPRVDDDGGGAAAPDAGSDALLVDTGSLDASSPLDSTLYDVNFRCPTPQPSDVLYCEDFDTGAADIRAPLVRGPSDGSSTAEVTRQQPGLGKLRVDLNNATGFAYASVPSLNTGTSFFAAMDLELPTMSDTEGLQEIAFWGNPNGQNLTVLRGSQQGKQVLVFNFNGAGGGPPQQNFEVSSGWHRIALEGSVVSNVQSLRVRVDAQPPRSVAWPLPASPTGLRLGMSAANGTVVPPLVVSYDSVIVIRR